MKIAVVTDDGKTVSKHFGRAAHFAVLTLEGGRVQDVQMRPNPGRESLDLEAHEMRRGSPGAARDCHGEGAAGAAAHQAVAAAIRDCEAVLAGGMSWASRECLAANGIRPIITDIEDLHEAAHSYAAGTIVDHTEWLH
ncbi:MAG: NifB/NifX family molybdenum-iron cluster-binding protein [Anaerolineae bacterium]|jgi:predicted Fe-Mo cluster-binding NifX family protein|nr:NifB/NifX family molybdenum-iron cluster-binding protein [Anaerolineae bacterium]